MGIAPCENVKGFAHSRPPVMVFMLCLGLFAVVLMTLAYYVKVTKLKNPDVTQDWNLFLGNLAELEFCMQGNSSDYAGPTTSSPLAAKGVNSPTTTLPPTSDLKSRETTEDTKLEAEGTRNYSVYMLVTVLPTKDFVRMPYNLTFLTASIEAKQVGLLGLLGEEVINVTIQLPFDWNVSHCSPDCQQIQILTCVHLVAPSAVFPSSKSPQVCENLNDTGSEYHASMLPLKPKLYSPYYCRQRPVIKVQHKLDPTLTVWLSLNDRSVMNLHLMHTSYFLFVMVVTLLCYAVIRGGTFSSKLSQVQSESQVPLTEA